MTLQGVKSDTAKPPAAVFECRPCKLSITDTIGDDPSKRTLQ
jgi:hypothetical protein